MCHLHESVQTNVEHVQDPKIVKRKIALVIGYLGGRYHGSASTQNMAYPAVEDVLLQAIKTSNFVSTLTQEGDCMKKISWQRASRTDKGVHAHRNVVSLKIQHPLSLSLEAMRSELQNLLPSDIRIFDVLPVTHAFNSHRNCSSRVYRYILPSYALLGQERRKSLISLIQAFLKQEERTNDKAVESGERVKIEATNSRDECEQQSSSLGAQSSEQGLSSTNSPRSSRSLSGRSDGIIEDIQTIQSLSPSFFDFLETNIDTADLQLTKLDELLLQKANQCLARYQGTHSFHNFTHGYACSDPRVMRYIMSATIEKLIVRNENGGSYDVLRVEITGQSFLINQIRKMVAAVLCTVNEGRAISEFEELLKPDIQKDVPLLPANGLFLHTLHFESYNAKLRRIQTYGNASDKSSIDLSDLNAWEFEKEIINHILRHEKEKRRLAKWLCFAHL